MATLDIFNNDAFSVTSLLETIVDIPRVPTMLGDLGLFNERGINGTTFFIERKGAALTLVPTSPRGSPGQPTKTTNRKAFPLATVHMQENDVVLADEVLGVRAFGSETEVETVQNILRGKLEVMRANLELTHEYQRLGALKGTVLDADGSSVILDVYSAFGMTQTTLFWNTVTAGTSIDPLALTRDLKSRTRKALGGRTFRNVRVICSSDWLNKFMFHNKMKEAYALWRDGGYLRANLAQQANGGYIDFVFDDVVFSVYELELGGTSAIGDQKAYSFPEGVSDMFQTVYSPADYVETVGTTGLPFYAKQERMRMDRGVEIEMQSNPLHFNKYPEAVFALSTAAS
jgi:hypothetical protein